MRIENARIRSADLFIEDHGILTAFVDLEFDNSIQGFGGYAFDGYDRDSNPSREGRKYSSNCALFVRRTLETVEVDQWSKLVGKIIRVTRDDALMIVAIGHPVKERWFCPKDEFVKE